MRKRYISIRGIVPLKNKIFERNGNIAFLSSYQIKEENIFQYIKYMENFNPEYLHVYPSSIYLISKLIVEENLKISLPNLKVILSSSEVFPDYQKKVVEQVFKCKILDLYGNTENTMHGLWWSGLDSYFFNKIYSYVEIEDNEIIATSFNEKVMPLIRYKTGDLIEYLEEKKFIIAGRKQDYIYGKNNEIFHLNWLMQHYSIFGKISAYQIIQEEKGKIIIIIEKSQNRNLKKDEEEIEKRIEELTNKSIDVIFLYRNIERGARGKYKYLIQKLK